MNNGGRNCEGECKKKGGRSRFDGSGRSEADGGMLECSFSGLPKHIGVGEAQDRFTTFHGRARATDLKLEGPAM